MTSSTTGLTGRAGLNDLQAVIGGGAALTDVTLLLAARACQMAGPKVHGVAIAPYRPCPEIEGLTSYLTTEGLELADFTICEPWDPDSVRYALEAAEEAEAAVVFFIPGCNVTNLSIHLNGWPQEVKEYLWERILSGQVIPCGSSAGLVLWFMLFITADVQGTDTPADHYWTALSPLAVLDNVLVVAHFDDTITSAIPPIPRREALLTTLRQALINGLDYAGTDDDGTSVLVVVDPEQFVYLGVPTCGGLRIVRGLVTVIGPPGQYVERFVVRDGEIVSWRFMAGAPGVPIGDFFNASWDPPAGSLYRRSPRHLRRHHPGCAANQRRTRRATPERSIMH